MAHPGRPQPRRFTFSADEVAVSHARHPGPVYTHLELRTRDVDYALAFLNPSRVYYLRRELAVNAPTQPLAQLTLWEHSRVPGRDVLDRNQVDISSALYDQARSIERVNLSWGAVLRPLAFDLEQRLVVLYDAKEVDVHRVCDALRIVHKYMRRCHGDDDRFSQFVHWVFYFTDPNNLFVSTKPVTYKLQDDATKRNHKAIHDFVLRLVRPSLVVGAAAT